MKAGVRLPPRRDPAVAAIVAAWRRLTTPAGARRAGPGQPVLVACSGGADSAALVLALAAAGAPLAVAHVLHDLRPLPEAEADRDAVCGLARELGLAFVEASVRVKGGGGNLEGAARGARYAALAKLARGKQLGFIATAHHVDDQLETVLMALVRGAGPRGLAGVAESRPLGKGAAGLRVIRPMLTAGVGRADAERICRLAGYAWREDPTNLDESRLRAAVRRRVVPLLKELRPTVARRAAHLAELMRDVDVILRAQAEHLSAQRETPLADEELRWTFPRARLRLERGAVLGELLRLAQRELAASGADRLGFEAVSAVTRAIRDDSTQPRRFELGGIRVGVTSRAVSFEARRPR